MRVTSMSVAAVLVLAAGCGSSTSPPYSPNSGGGQGQGGSQTTIAVNNNYFNPTPDTVAAGQVTFSWTTSPPSNGHNVAWDTGPGTLPIGSQTQTSGNYVVTLQVGTYTYHCTIHGAGIMHGTIVVH